MVTGHRVVRAARGMFFGWWIVAAGIGVQMMPIRADYFGRQAFGTIMGFTFMFMMWGEVGGPIGMGLIVDNLGDYRLGFGLLGGAAARAACFFASSGQPPRLERADVGNAAG